MVKAECVFDMAVNLQNKVEKRFEEINIWVIQNAQKYLKSRDIVLDFGCATGTKTLELASGVKEIRGIDISSKMIEAAKRNAAERRVVNVDFEKTTIFSELFEKESFDVILALNVLHLLEDDDLLLVVG